jgi:ATP-dependent Clp protease adaptor protein ClpS
METYIPDTQEKDDTEVDLKEPSMYKVLLHNDDYTPMDFVVEILMIVFNKSPEIATAVMMNVHRQGIGICGVYTYDVAETKVNTVHVSAQEQGFPLRCSMEENV